MALACTPLSAAIFESDRLTLVGDVRLRLEQDYDSQDADGVERDDRLRARLSARFEVTFRPGHGMSVGARLRTGSDMGQQSPFITIVDFDNNDTGDADFNFDKWYLAAERAGFRTWAGRNSIPLWKQNEFLWDDDVTPAGLGAGYRADLGAAGRISVNAGYLTPPVGMQSFSGSVAVGQAVYEASPGPLDVTLAAGFLGFEADPNDPDGALLLEGNGDRDYTILIGSGSVTFDVAGLPLSLGVDVIRNIEDYDGEDPNSLTYAARDETSGFVMQASLSRGSGAGGWQAAWYYAKIETLAVNNSFSQDDWTRWGSPTQSRVSNFRGHEVRFVYTATERVSLMTRIYIVEAITTGEDGNRIRTDMSYKF